MIPPLDDGVLPEGIHDCTFAEIEQMFGRFQRTDRRIRLCEKLKAYLVEARTVSFVQAIIVDGSFVTAKEEPGDIDLIVVLEPGYDFTQQLRPFEYNVIVKTGVKRQGYPFDVFPLAEGTAELQRMIEFFTRVDPEKHGSFTSRPRKGILRILK